MTPTELLTFIGRAWARLVLYPGGLAAFALIVLAGAAFSQAATPLGGRLRLALRQLAAGFDPTSLASLSAVALPWLGLALLPAPGAVALSRSTDVVVTLALLEWAMLLGLAVELRAAPDRSEMAGYRLAGLLNGYPPLLLALGLLALSGGSLQIELFARPPSPQTPALTAALHWLGAGALVAVMPPLAGLGPFAVPLPPQPALALGLRLRALGLLLLATQPLLALAEIAVWLPIPPIVGMAALLLGVHRGARAQPARRWALGYLALSCGLLLALLAGTGAALLQRLQ